MSGERASRAGRALGISLTTLGMQTSELRAALRISGLPIQARSGRAITDWRWIEAL